MSLLTHVFQQDGNLVTATVDKYGDQNLATKVSTKCKFRYITQVERGVSAEMVASFDAMAWFEPDTDIIEGSIIEVDGRYWRVDRLIKARRLTSDEVLFLKVFVKKHELAGIEEGS